MGFLHLAIHLSRRSRSIGVMVVLPYYLHDYKAFGRITILGEFLAIPAVIMCVTLFVADLASRTAR